tara:strand:- start:370 stop:594 length:225 start_codon:yes stop_codon:yes gene_type:complete
MKYNIGEKVIINDTEWEIKEYRMGRGKEWIYTLNRSDGTVDEDGNVISMSLNNDAMDGVSLNGKMIGIENEISE